MRKPRRKGQVAAGGGADLRKSDVRKSNVRKSDVKKSDARKSDVKKSDVRKSDVRKSDVKKSDVRKSDVRKSNGTVGGRGGARQRSPSPYSLKASPSRETLTYAQAQKVVEVELDGRLHRISILEPLEVITEDEMMAQDISECNSNKENSEQSSSPTSSAQTARKPVTPRGRRKDPKSSPVKSPPPPSKNHCPKSHPQTPEKLNTVTPSPHDLSLNPSSMSSKPSSQSRHLLCLRLITVTLNA
ncbi:Bromodomain and PHD finger-containing protein 3 [Larimichthys crocea]|uniref:Uncharacterized protein n=1 Tax=Larimichthys crocea TaxID=215358 RepID=A0ACD3R933_LARCR|nr:Bromodomain and PHD finger-containing protein 3 [Larimichthys crocea]